MINLENCKNLFQLKKKAINKTLKRNFKTISIDLTMNSWMMFMMMSLFEIEKYINLINVNLQGLNHLSHLF